MKRSGWLRRETPLRRSRSKLKRTPLRPVGKKADEHEARMRELRPLVHERDEHRCRALDRYGFGHDCFGRLRVHHLWPTERGGPDELDNLVLICEHAHDLVHNFRVEEAKSRGLLLDKQGYTARL